MDKIILKSWLLLKWLSPHSLANWYATRPNASRLCRLTCKQSCGLIISLNVRVSFVFQTLDTVYIANANCYKYRRLNLTLWASTLSTPSMSLFCNPKQLQGVTAWKKLVPVRCWYMKKTNFTWSLKLHDCMLFSTST